MIFEFFTFKIESAIYRKPATGATMSATCPSGRSET